MCIEVIDNESYIYIIASTNLDNDKDPIGMIIYNKLKLITQCSLWFALKRR